jgi:hypothetical protein
MGSFAQAFPASLQQPPIGTQASLNNLTGAFAATTVFTAPVTGYYMILSYARIVSTDGAGSITPTIIIPHITPNLTLSPTLSPVQDGTNNGGGYFLNAGDQIQLSATASGLGATTWQFFNVIIQML